MSSSVSELPVYTINVGTPGTYTNETNTDITGLVDGEIANAPIGYAIKIIFNPGSYGEITPLRLPSNTSVIGNDATLVDIRTGRSANTLQGMITNADSYFEGSTVTINNSTGSPTEINYNQTVNTIQGDAATAIFDTNISVQGMVFKLNGSDFGTWFVNSTNVDVQNNTYIGGQDGNAFVNVVGAIAAENIATGQTNCSYDDWNGPTNITIADNTSFSPNHATQPGASWAVLINSTPTGDPNNAGNATNDAVVSNSLGGAWSYSAAVEATALLSYGVSAEANITEQGNTYTDLGGVNSGGEVSAGNMTNLVLQNNTYVNENSEQPTPTSAIQVTADGSLEPSVSPIVDGNLVLGATSDNGSPAISNDGFNPTSMDNAVLNASDWSTVQVNTGAQGGSASSAGNIASVDGTLVGNAVLIGVDIYAPPQLITGADSPTQLSGLVVLDNSPANEMTITVSCEFGSLSTDGMIQNLQYETIGGEPSIVLTGSLSEIDQALNDITYTSNSAGWDDALKVTITDSAGFSGVRYIPVLIPDYSSQMSNVTTLTSNKLNGTVNTGSQIPQLSSDTVIASAGNDVVSMGSSDSIVLLGSGNDSVQGGFDSGYIATGSGSATVDLSSGGATTVAGGSGQVSVNASTGNNLVEAGSGNTSVFAGAGANTVLGGLGNLDIQGGSGDLYLATLPENGGNISANLGNGSSTLLGLSGDMDVTTQSNTENFIYAGFGMDSIYSGGNDEINTGAGQYTINASAGGDDTVSGTSGSVDFIGGSGNSLLFPSADMQIQAGSGNMTLEGAGNFSLSLTPSNSNRSLYLPGLSDGLTVTQFGQFSIAFERLSGEMLNVLLVDGTQLHIYDPSGSGLEQSGSQLMFGGSLKYWVHALGYG